MGADPAPEHIPEIDRYRCRLCGEPKVVPSLARQCEYSHLEDES